MFGLLVCRLLKPLLLVGAFFIAVLAQASTLSDVRERDTLNCGVSFGLPGFALQDAYGRWTGMDIDLCRSVAAATLGNAAKVTYIPLDTEDRFSALQQGKVDLLARNTTWNLTRDTSLGLLFAGVSYFDGQGFMARKKLRARSSFELDGARFCVLLKTTSEQNLDEFLSQYEIKASKRYFSTSVEAARAFESGKCDVLTSDMSQLYAWRARLRDPLSVVVFPEVISKEPLGPVVRDSDSQWFNIVKWSLFALINAEELGVSSHNLESMKSSSNPQTARLLHDHTAKSMGLEPAWARNIIEQVGNYGEIYHRNVGRGSPLQIDRSLNALWSEGGILYAPPFK